MNRLLSAAMLAGALLVGSAARAEAHGGFGFGVGVGISFNWSCWSGCPSACPPAPVDFIIPVVPQHDYIPMRPIVDGY